MNPFRFKSVLLIPLLLLIAGMLRGQTFVLRGTVFGEYDKQPLDFATVMTGDRKIGTYTNISGEYELSFARVPDTIIFKQASGDSEHIDTVFTGLRAMWPQGSSLMHLVMPMRESPPFGPITVIRDRDFGIGRDGKRMKKQ